MKEEEKTVGKGRGAGPQDREVFGEAWVRQIHEATKDMGYLLDRGYAETSALKLVGDRYQLHLRQRSAVMRCAVGEKDIRLIKSKEVRELRGEALAIDGFNVIILLETAVGGGLILEGADGGWRDLSSVHGTYRMVEQTAEIVRRFGQWLKAQGVGQVVWWIDEPVSNSGRLAQLLRTMGEEEGWAWEARTTPYVDREVAQTSDIAATTDKAILRRCGRWSNVGKAFLSEEIKEIWKLCFPDPARFSERSTVFPDPGISSPSDVE